MLNDIIEKYFLHDIVSYKNKKKVSDDDFYIIKYNQKDKLLDTNYTLNQLKKIARHYNLSTGNKELLRKKIYNFFKCTKFCIFIQKNFRRYLVKQYIILHGPGFKKRELCNNIEDFCTLDNILKIPYTNFISYIDNNNFIYGFDIVSIYNLYLKNKNNLYNPYTKESLNNNFLKIITKFIKYSKLLKINLNINYNEHVYCNENKKLDLQIMSLFQKMDSLGNYTDSKWFTDLNKYNLIKFVKELLDIWNYRANLSLETKRAICPPLGKPFNMITINYNSLEQYTFYELKKNIVNIISLFINKGINDSYKTLGSYYVLSALTLVNNDTAQAIPWLYESVIY